MPTVVLLVLVGQELLDVLVGQPVAQELRELVSAELLGGPSAPTAPTVGLAGAGGLVVGLGWLGPSRRMEPIRSIYCFRALVAQKAGRWR